MARIRIIRLLAALLLGAVAAPTGGAQFSSARRLLAADGRSCAVGSARFVSHWRRHRCNDGR